MEKPNQNNEKIQEWIQCTSKSRPGLKYMFNTATGESKWLTKDGGTKEAPATGDKNCTAKKIKVKTPAQDRLKRLQKDIAKAPKNQAKSLKLANKSNVINKTEVNLKKPNINENIPSQDNKLSTGRSRKRANSSPERPKKLSKQLEDILEKTKVLKQTTVHFKIPKKKTVSTSHNTSHKVSTETINGCQDLSKKPTKNLENGKRNELGKKNYTNVAPQLDCEFEKNAAKILAKPLGKEKTGLAKKRLEELRKSLQKVIDSKGDDISERLERQNYINNLKSPKEDDDVPMVEPMDWEPDNTKIEPTANVTKEKVTVRSNYNKNTINENLRHYANGQRSPTEKEEKWQKDFYYFIPDTNVFLDHITFLDELITMKLNDTQGTMLYIPYVVIKELDGLKMRENVALRARRAINYIHDKLKNKCPNVQTQSAIDERDYIIEVDEPDDAIINCCLQVQRRVDKVLLLSEDTNLRNKAQCNDLLVSTKSDLVSCHAHVPSPKYN